MTRTTMGNNEWWGWQWGTIRDDDKSKRRWVGVGEVGDNGRTIDGDNVGEQRGTTNGSRQQWGQWQEQHEQQRKQLGR